jgi:hypothetical protein
VGRLSEVPGGNEEDIAECQDRMGQGIIAANHFDLKNGNTLMAITQYFSVIKSKKRSEK